MTQETFLERIARQRRQRANRIQALAASMQDALVAQGFNRDGCTLTIDEEGQGFTLDLATGEQYQWLLIESKRPKEQ